MMSITNIKLRLHLLNKKTISDTAFVFFLPFENLHKVEKYTQTILMYTVLFP